MLYLKEVLMIIFTFLIIVSIDYSIRYVISLPREEMIKKMAESLFRGTGRIALTIIFNGLFFFSIGYFILNSNIKFTPGGIGEAIFIIFGMFFIIQFITIPIIWIIIATIYFIFNTILLFIISLMSIRDKTKLLKNN
jgi:hypothetical protein